MAKKRSEVVNVGTKEEAEKANAESNGKSKKTPCPITRQQFKDNAKVIIVKLETKDGQLLDTIKMEPREFSTGSMGWYPEGGEKAKVDVGGTEVKCQVGFNLTIVNSKEVPGYVKS